MKVKISFLLIFIALCANWALAIGVPHTLKLFNFHASFPSECDQENIHCYTVEEIVKNAIENSPSARQQVYTLFQARQQVKVQVGQLLPQINLSNIIDNAISSAFSLDSIVPLVGFLFPGRWFNFGASKNLRDAEAESLNALYGNLALHIQLLNYNIQSQIWNMRIYEHYSNQIKALIDYFEDQQSPGYGRASKEEIALLENELSVVVFSLGFANNLSAYYPQLAYAMGYDPNLDWGEMHLMPEPVVSLSKAKIPVYEKLWSKVLERSPEVRNIEFLIEAAKNNKNASYYNFIDPASGTNLNVGFGPTVKINRAAIKNLKEQLKGTRQELSTTIQTNINYMQQSLTSIPSIEHAFVSLENIRSDVERHINNRKEKLNIQKIIRYFVYSRNQAINYVVSFFNYKNAEATLNRYTWTDVIYEKVLQIEADKLSIYLSQVNEETSLRGTLSRKMAKIKGGLKAFSSCLKTLRTLGDKTSLTTNDNDP